MTAALAAGCGGGSGDTMRATLTDDACTYEGDRTPAPGLFEIVENKSSQFAIFNVWALAAGKSVEDVQRALEQTRPAGTLDGLFESGSAASTATNPEATSVLPVNASSGRYVITCWVHASVDPRLQSEQLPPPAAVHVVPVALEVGSPLAPP